MSKLVSMIDGYLFVCKGFDQPWQKQYRANEANRIAAKIRDTFGRFDESDQERCAWIIRAVMKAEPEARSANPKPDPKVYNAWEKKVLAEAKARKERDTPLRKCTWSF